MTTASDEGERMRALEELIRELVKFTSHDKACNELKPIEQLPTDEMGFVVSGKCTCGIRRLYAKIDELVD